MGAFGFGADVGGDRRGRERPRESSVVLQQFGDLVASSDDPYCPIEVAERLASRWGSGFRNAGQFGHLNAASGLGEWERGTAVLAEVVRG
jgi:predicted alpha/beta hydrolase family esterase